MTNKSYLVLLALLFLVSACGKGGEGGKMAKESGTTSAVPTAPTGITAVSGKDRITVKWQPSQGAASYIIYYGAKPGAEKMQGEKITDITETSYEHIGVKRNAMYYYVVTAVNESGESTASTESGAMVQPVALPAPSNVAASGGDGKLTVRWKEVPGASSYNIYYGTNPGSARTIGKKITGIKSTQYLFADVKKKTMYFFAVTALNDSGESPASNESGAMP